MSNENQNINRIQDSNNMDLENENDPSDMVNGLGDNEAIHKLENEMFSSNNDTVEKKISEMNYKNTTHIKTGLKIENLNGKILNFSLNNQKLYQSPQNGALSEEFPNKLGIFNPKSHGDKSFLGESYKINHINLTDFSLNMLHNEEKNFSQNLNIKDNNIKGKVGIEEIIDDKNKMNDYNINLEKNIIENNEKKINNFEDNNKIIEIELNEDKNLEMENFYNYENKLLNQTSEKRVSTKDNSFISKKNYFMNFFNNDNNDEEFQKKDSENICQIMSNDNRNNLIPEEEFRTVTTSPHPINNSLSDLSPTQFSNNGNDD